MEDISQKIADTIRAYHLKGWSPATSTNYSYRNNDTDAIINVSRSGVDKSTFVAEDFICVDMEGNPTFGFEKIKPSAETLIHCIIYQLFPETTVILHSHSPYSVLMSQKFDQSIPFNGYEIQKGFAGQSTHEGQVSVPIFPNSQDMEYFKNALNSRVSELGNHSFVIRQHGTYAWGKNLFEAKRHLETLEYLLEVEWKLRSANF